MQLFDRESTDKLGVIYQCTCLHLHGHWRVYVFISTYKATARMEYFVGADVRA
jgi:hypothetical protein